MANRGSEGGKSIVNSSFLPLLEKLISEGFSFLYPMSEIEAVSLLIRLTACETRQEAARLIVRYIRHLDDSFFMTADRVRASLRGDEKLLSKHDSSVALVREALEFRQDVQERMSVIEELVTTGGELGFSLLMDNVDKYDVLFMRSLEALIAVTQREIGNEWARSLGRLKGNILQVQRQLQSGLSTSDIRRIPEVDNVIGRYMNSNFERVVDIVEFARGNADIISRPDFLKLVEAIAQEWEWRNESRLAKAVRYSGDTLYVICPDLKRGNVIEEVLYPVIALFGSRSDDEYYERRYDHAYKYTWVIVRPDFVERAKELAEQWRRKKNLEMAEQLVAAASELRAVLKDLWEHAWKADLDYETTTKERASRFIHEWLEPGTSMSVKLSLIATPKPLNALFFATLDDEIKKARLADDPDLVEKLIDLKTVIRRELEWIKTRWEGGDLEDLRPPLLAADTTIAEIKHVWRTGGIRDYQPAPLEFEWLADAYRDAGKFEDALREYRKAVKEYEKDGRFTAAGEVYFRIAEVYGYLGDYARAISVHEAGILLLLKEAEPLQFANALRRLIPLYGVISDNEGVIRCAVVALEIVNDMINAMAPSYSGAVTDGNRADVEKLATAYGIAGDIWIMIQQYEQALVHYKQTRELFEQLGDSGDVFLSCKKLGEAYSAMGLHHKALESWEAALSILKKQDTDSGHKQVNDPEGPLGPLSVLKRQDKGSGPFDTQDAAREESSLSMLLAESYSALGAVQTSIQHVRRALFLSRKLGLHNLLWSAYYHLADYQKQAGDIRSALQNLLRAQREQDVLRQQLNIEQYKLRVLAAPLPAVEHTVLLYWECGKNRSAFRSVERGSSRVFLDVLAYSSLAMPAIIPPELSKRVVDLTVKLQETYSELRQATADFQREAILNDLTRQRKRMDYLLDQIEKIAPEYASIRRGKPATYPEVRQCLQNM
jgi:tetratricopeptide (TPR) repeat protein